MNNTNNNNNNNNDSLQFQRNTNYRSSLQDMHKMKVFIDKLITFEEFCFYFNYNFFKR